MPLFTRQMTMDDFREADLDHLEHNYNYGTPEVRAARERAYQRLMQNASARETPSPPQYVNITVTQEGPTLFEDSASGANSASPSDIHAMLLLRAPNGSVLAPNDPAQLFIMTNRRCKHYDNRVYHVFDERRRIPIYDEVEIEVDENVTDFRSNAEMQAVWSISHIEMIEDGRCDFWDQIRNPFNFNNAIQSIGLQLNPAMQSYGGYQHQGQFTPATHAYEEYQQQQLSPATQSYEELQPRLQLYPARHSYEGYLPQPLTIQQFFPAVANQYLNPSQGARAANNGN